MTILSTSSIRHLCEPLSGHPLLDPFVERSLDPVTGTTFGLGPCTYDIRLLAADLPSVSGQGWVLLPGQFALGSTVERFCMPPDLCAHVMDKSSLARQGLSVFNTHIDPGWRGWLTVELSNRGPWSVRLHPGMPIAQVKFEQLDWPTMQPYRGKYQDQPAHPVRAIEERER